MSKTLSIYFVQMNWFYGLLNELFAMILVQTENAFLLLQSQTHRSSDWLEGVGSFMSKLSSRPIRCVQLLYFLLSSHSHMQSVLVWIGIGIFVVHSAISSVNRTISNWSKPKQQIVCVVECASTSYLKTAFIIAIHTPANDEMASMNHSASNTHWEQWASVSLQLIWSFRMHAPAPVVFELFCYLNLGWYGQCSKTCKSVSFLKSTVNLSNMNRYLQMWFS